jgi:hypothetical protein
MGFRGNLLFEYEDEAATALRQDNYLHVCS